MVPTSDEAGGSGPLGPVFQIIPGVQSYDWGKLAKDGSLVAQFAEATEDLGFQKKDDEPYAEVSVAQFLHHDERSS
jgi:mannose-6-phosphate isomerase class I